MTDPDLHADTAADEEIVVVDDAPEPEPQAKTEAPPTERTEDRPYRKKTAEVRIAELTRARREAEAVVQRERARADAAERALYETRKNSLTATDAALTRDLDFAKERHRQAFSEGDADKVATAAAELAELAARRADVQREARQQPAPQQSQPQVQFTPKTQAYIDANPWFTEDPDAQATAITADAAARRRGIAADTPEYFEFVTKRVKAVHPEHFEDPEEDEIEQPRRSAAPPVAPARRTVPGMAAPKGKLPSLTAAEAEFARSAGIDLKDYAQQKARLAAAGELGIRK